MADPDEQDTELAVSSESAPPSTVYIGPIWVTRRSVLEFDPDSEHRTEEARRLGVASTTYWVREVRCGATLEASFVEAEMRGSGGQRGDVVRIPMRDVTRYLRLHHHEPVNPRLSELGEGKDSRR